MRLRTVSRFPPIYSLKNAFIMPSFKSKAWCCNCLSTLFSGGLFAYNSFQFQSMQGRRPCYIIVPKPHRLSGLIVGMAKGLRTPRGIKRLGLSPLLCQHQCNWWSFWWWFDGLWYKDSNIKEHLEILGGWENPEEIKYCQRRYFHLSCKVLDIQHICWISMWTMWT